MNQPASFRRYKLPLQILAAFLIAAVWVGIGRLLFGVFGWMAFITLFMFAPVIVLYGAVLAIVTAIRQQGYLYRPRGPLKKWLFVTLVALFCVGFFMPDAGDTSDSLGSALSVLAGYRTNSALIGASGTLAGWSIFVAVVAAIGTMIAAVVERPKHEESANRNPAGRAGR